MYKAVIFDLFGTLVNKFPIDESIDVLIEMAAVLRVPSDDFTKLWFATFDDIEKSLLQFLGNRSGFTCTDRYFVY